nr:MAG TPA: hypothetical protein [Caudoviricetes sp.]
MINAWQIILLGIFCRKYKLEVLQFPAIQVKLM